MTVSHRLVCVGKSSLVYPAAAPPKNAIAAGAVTLQVNPNPTDLDASFTVAIRRPSGTVLPRLVPETWGVSSARARAVLLLIELNALIFNVICDTVKRLL
jgi:hypothetical protein